MSGQAPEGDDGWPRGFASHRRAQAGLGLAMTPAERLRWLEETMATLRRWQGRARTSGVPAAAEATEAARPAAPKAG
jgi:hypothetical protein